MSDHDNETNEPVADLQSPAESSTGSLIVSLSFWCSLMAASLMYAAVSLSPRLEEWLTARDQYASNAHRLQVLENEVDYLERVVDAMKKDPEFARRMSEQIQLSPGSVSESAFEPTTVAARDGSLPSSVGAPAPEQPRLPSSALPGELRRWILDLATNPELRIWLLGTAAGLTLLAFTLLNESGKAIVLAVFGTIASVLHCVTSRYFRRAEPASTEPTEKAGIN
jgi:hypothetical protein